MVLIIQNQTAGTLSYLGGLVTVAGGGNLTVPNQYLYPISKDPGLLNDSLQANVNISDGVQTYLTVQAASYLSTVSTSIGGAVVGLIGSAVPGYAICVGGRDPNGNAIFGAFDSSGNLKTNDHASSTTGTGVPTSASYIAGSNPSGNLQGISTDTSGKMYVDLFDGSGNPISSINSQIENRDVLNVSSQYKAQSVSNSAIQALGGDSVLVNRKLITITPTNGTIYWGTNSSVTTSNGSPLFPNNTLFLSCTDNSPIYLISATTTDVRVSEFS